MGIFDLFKRKKTSDVIPENAEIIFAENFMIFGGNYECRKNPKKQRIDVIHKTKEGDAVHLEEYMYEGKTAYMIVHDKQKLDMGILGAGSAEILARYYSQGNVIVKLIGENQSSFCVEVVVIKN